MEEINETELKCVCGGAKADGIEIEGEITEVLPNGCFKVRLDNGHVVSAYLVGKLRINYIKMIVGDRVMVEVSTYDLQIGKITRYF